MKVTGKMSSEEIEVKRFYLPGVKLEGQCPKCHAPMVVDFSSEYLSYPWVGTFDHSVYCPECDHEWNVELTLDITLSVSEAP